MPYMDGWASSCSLDHDFGLMHAFHERIFRGAGSRQASCHLPEHVILEMIIIYLSIILGMQIVIAKFQPTNDPTWIYWY